MACGWWVAVAAVGRQVRVVLQFDPDQSMPENGIKVMVLSPAEAIDLRDSLTEAIDNAAALELRGLG